MKRVYNLVVLCLMSIILLFCFSGCGESDVVTNQSGENQNSAIVQPNEDQDSDNAQEEDSDAYELLTSAEKYFFDAFKNKISLFKNPASVKINTIVGSYYNQSYFDFSVSAQNSFGATITEGYLLFAKLWTAPDVTEIKYGDYGNTALAGTMLSYSEFSNGTFFSAYAKLSIIDPDAKDCDTYTYSVPKINKAIKEYQIFKGWL